MKLYNTLSRTIEDFKPIDENLVKMYTCGPTVYNYAHIGNLRTYIHEDVLEKTLRYIGYPVKRVMNITDVGHLESDADDGEDKMLKGAKRENKTVWEIAQHYTDAFFEDSKKLNIKKADVIGKATDYIDDYIEFIKVLEKKGYTYNANGNVYFDISKRNDYTKLSGMDLDQLRTASRDEVTEDLHKKNPQDFVLWFTKSKFDNQAMKWDSPWGVGYPGWHIECSVISLKNLGEQMDIHCGGVDHVPVHHTNEIAQTESYTGKKWVNYWWHGEFLIDNNGKMSKSSGEFLTLSLLEKKGFNPLSYRYYILNSHYRKQLAFSFDSLKSTENAYLKLKSRIKTIKENEVENEQITDVVNKYIQNFKNSLEEDLNTANAITVLYDALKAEELTNSEKLFVVKDFEQVLSLDLLKFEDEKVTEIHDDEVKMIEDMIQKRQAAKKNKDFQLADSIRAELLEKGIVLEDTRQGVNWKKEVKMFDDELIKKINVGVDNKKMMHSPAQLAYAGDAVYELLVRSYIINNHEYSVNQMHRQAIKFVKAKAQAELVKKLNPILTEEEIRIVKRGRNAKVTSSPKNADLMDYRYATGFETLFGYLYLNNELDRLMMLFNKIIEIIDKKDDKDENN